MPAKSIANVSDWEGIGMTTSLPSTRVNSTSLSWSMPTSAAKDLGIRTAKLLPHFWIRVRMDSSVRCRYKEYTSERGFQQVDLDGKKLSLSYNPGSPPVADPFDRAVKPLVVERRAADRALDEGQLGGL